METKQIAAAALVGWRRDVADRIVGPIARRTRLDADDLRALAGAAATVLLARRLVLTARSVASEARR